MPWACSFSAVLAPTPHSRRTGSGCRKASSRSGGTSSSPSGLASWLATLARNLVRAMPTVIGRPTRSRTCARSRAAISTGVPDTRRRPDTSRNASSTDQRLDERRGVAEDLEHRVAGLASTPTSAAARRSRAGTVAGPGGRPSRCAPRRPWPRSWRRARRRRRRSPAGRAARGRLAARPRRRTSRGRRAGWPRPSAVQTCPGHEHMFASTADKSACLAVDAGRPRCGRACRRVCSGRRPAARRRRPPSSRARSSGSARSPGRGPAWFPAPRRARVRPR